jgi:hypothetical protein
MRDEERIARLLAEALTARCTDSEITVAGGGVHWNVQARRGARSCAVNCFWYDAAIHGLMLGMNPSNARTALRPAIKPHHGAEYRVTFVDGEGRNVADGRAREEEAAIASIDAWLSGVELAEIEQRWPYVDEEPRRYRAVLALLEPRCRDVARCVLETSPVNELWVYGHGRSCQVYVNGDGVGVSFRLGHVQVAFVSPTNDVAGMVDRWMRGAKLLDMVEAGAVLESHAELLEAGEAARWHWEHTCERIEDDGDVLVDSRPLLRRLAQSDVATQFFSFSSLNRFCFSASSHYPWVADGLPVIYPPYENRGYCVEIGRARTECTIDEAVELVENTLRAYPVRPFFGSATGLVVEPVNAELERQGSALRADIAQHGQWYRAELSAGTRRCTIAKDRWTVTFAETDAADRHESFKTVAAAVTAILGWLEPRTTA